MIQNKQKTLLSFAAGFTLIEILIVIGILLVLLTVTLLALNPSRQFVLASDTQRKADLRTYHSALAQYYIDNRCLPTQTDWQTIACSGQVPESLKPYLADVPCDPDSNAKYFYQPLDKDCKPCNAGCGVCLGFRLMATLRNTDDPAITASGCDPVNGCGVTDENGQNYNYALSFSCPNVKPSRTPTPNATSTPVPTPTPTSPPVTSCTNYVYANSVTTGFNQPEGLTYDRTKNVLYVANNVMQNIKKISLDLNVLSTWPLPGNTEDYERRPTDVATDSQGNVYVIDNHNERVLKLDENGNLIYKFGGRGTGNGKFVLPRYITVDESDNFYVTDSGNHLIQKFAADGTFITQWGSQGTGDGQFGISASGMMFDADGNLLVTDTQNNRIQEFDSGGNFIRKWGTYGYVSTNMTYVGLYPGQFLYPMAIAVAGDKSIFVADSLNHRIQKFDENRQYVTMWGYWGDGYSTPTQINTPRGVAVDPSGNVYVSDTGHHRIVKYICH